MDQRERPMQILTKALLIALGTLFKGLTEVLVGVIEVGISILLLPVALIGEVIVYAEKEEMKEV